MRNSGENLHGKNSRDRERLAHISLAKLTTLSDRSSEIHSNGLLNSVLIVNFYKSLQSENEQASHFNDDQSTRDIAERDEYSAYSDHYNRVERVIAIPCSKDSDNIYVYELYGQPLENTANQFVPSSEHYMGSYDYDDSIYDDNIYNESELYASQEQSWFDSCIDDANTDSEY
ncbi:hypothetical protein AX774_g225 [Zancudomyces culisetae]|uniref:Uncharacterized protein n=1 Tax=Zancudomyces culisetae TaxID=1213189 RepID=A0A1R1PYZ9_ZANCU|nr:hypothetical protein AX774_g225 [Zancudomyces culisetae]|eukprot:OMH86198.1 hypothetical protein AX774_g225 [Zancudomyces culisetae]